MAGPVLPSRDGAVRSWLLLLGGLVLTLAAVVGVMQVLGDDDGGSTTDLATEPSFDQATEATTPGAIGEPSERPTGTVPSGDVPSNLFASGLPAVIAQISAEAGDPQQLFEIAVYPTYAFLVYRDPANPGNIDRRMWRDGEVDDAAANPIDDRVDADTEPKLFTLAELDLSRIPALAADAITRYDRPVEVTHILIDRFLPFDERVLIRVYATPTDGRSGGGYVSYDTAGTFVDVCC